MTWRKGKNAPEEMWRGAAVVHGKTAYFRPGNESVKVFSYQNVPGEEQWSRLPDNPNEDFGLAVIDGLLTSVGGWNSNTLLSLRGEGERRQWSEAFPPMPTPRRGVACATTEQALVVAGGYGKGELDTVEVMDKNTKQWTTVSPLPVKCWSLSAAVCGDTLYLAGGYTGQNNHSQNSLLTCSLPDLLTSSNSLGSRVQRALLPSSRVWREAGSLPVVDSTLVSVGGDLLAIGGRYDSHLSTSNVYRYDSRTDSWAVASQMNVKRIRCLAVVVPGNQIVVVGGLTDYLRLRKTSEMEILDQ